MKRFLALSAFACGVLLLAGAVSTHVPLPNLSQLDMEYPNASPSDASTYYFGARFGAAGTTAQLHRMYVTRPCRITSAHVYFVVGGTLGTTEASSLYVRVNDTTDYLITDAFTLSAQHNIAFNQSLSINLAAGDYVEIKWVTPTWSTNPTLVIGHVFLGFHPY